MIFSVEYNEDLNFTIDMDSAYYSCSMMLNGEFLILRLTQVKMGGESYTRVIHLATLRVNKLPSGSIEWPLYL